jgi:hypothetical protein
MVELDEGAISELRKKIERVPRRNEINRKKITNC